MEVCERQDARTASPWRGGTPLSPMHSMEHALARISSQSPPIKSTINTNSNGKRPEAERAGTRRQVTKRDETKRKETNVASSQIPWNNNRHRKRDTFCSQPNPIMQKVIQLISKTLPPVNRPPQPPTDPSWPFFYVRACTKAASGAQANIYSLPIEIQTKFTLQNKYIVSVQHSCVIKAGFRLHLWLND